MSFIVRPGLVAVMERMLICPTWPSLPHWIRGKHLNPGSQSKWGQWHLIDLIIFSQSEGEIQRKLGNWQWEWKWTDGQASKWEMTKTGIQRLGYEGTTKQPIPQNYFAFCITFQFMWLRYSVIFFQAWSIFLIFTFSLAIKSSSYR